ncbi:MAG: HEAT repeat domain-containing protein [Pirellulaceae bacterium]
MSPNSSRVAWMLVVLAAVSYHAAAEDEFVAPPIRVPRGFTVELAAGPPLVKHPMMANFDDRGRLYIAESAGENLRRDDLEEQLPNFVRRLEDTDGDGRFDKSTIFADNLTFPQGALWHEGALYVASPPNIWRFEDTDDDGVADKREVLVSAFGYTGNAADIHGCFLGPQGRLYWCDGRHGHEHAAEDGTIHSTGKAARIFSCRTDGSDFRVHCGGGMDNPVEIDFTDEGEMLGTVNLFYRTRGDCLVHWMHGGVYPRFDQEPVVAEFKRTGDLLKEVHNYGHVAVSGTTRYRGEAFGKEYRDNFFVSEFNTHKIMRTVLKRDGSTFRASAEDFLVADSDDFHPTDVLEDADGSLLVIDTGGWFRIGCPTSQIAKPNILGAIYRIRRTGAEPIADPRGQKIDWRGAASESLADLLDDSRFAVRERAIQTLARRGDDAVEPLAAVLVNGNETTRRNAVWTCSRIGSASARKQLRNALSDRSSSVRQAAAFSLGSLRDAESVPSLVRLLDDEDPAVRRQTATALGQMGEKWAITALLAALSKDVDRVMEHALIYALIEIGEPGRTAHGLGNTNPRVKRGALIALNQMDGAQLRREDVAPLLDTTDVELQQVVLQVFAEHPDWAEGIVALLSEVLAGDKLEDPTASVIRGALYAFRNDADIQQLVAKRLRDEKTASSTRRMLLESIGRGGVQPLPAAWQAAIHEVLESDDDELVLQAATTAADLDTLAFAAALNKLASDEDRSPDVRAAALAAVARRGLPVSDDQFQFLVGQLHAESPPMRRLTAARALGTAQLDVRQRVRLVDIVAKAGPMEFAPLLAAFETTKDDASGKRLMTALAESPAADGLTETQLTRLLEGYGDEVRAAAKPLLGRLRAATAEQRQRLAEIEPQVQHGDAERGREVFFSKKASCYACHRVGEQGGAIGPDLSTIGQRRNRRDLLEAVLFPSASLARGFETYSLVTEAGRLYTGLIVRESADTLYVRTQQQQDLRLPRAEIEAIHPSTLSVMPAGLDKTMTLEQLEHLLAYLGSLK